MIALARRLVRPDPNDSAVPFAQFRRAVEHTRFSAVFTAHPTFSLPYPVGDALARAASGEAGIACFTSHRPTPVTLEDEFDQARAAITRGRDAIDLLTGAILDARARNLGASLARPHADDRSPWRAGSATTLTAEPISAGGIRCASACA